MTSSDRPTQAPPPPEPDVSARVRVDERARKLATRLEAGEVAVIDQPDLDRVTAQQLVAARPSAVLNAAPSTTGRYPNLGPGVLLDAGIILVDDLGADVMALREGDTVEVSGGTVFRKGELVATGRRRTAEDDHRAVEEARTGVSAQVEAFAVAVGEYLERDSGTLVEGEGLPDLRTRIAGRPVVVVMADPDTPRQLRALRSWMRDVDPVVIGVDAGADVATENRTRPDLVVGDLDTVSEAALTGGAELVLHEAHDGTAGGRDRLDRKGLAHVSFMTSGSSEDAAVLLAHLAGASVIVTVGSHGGLDDFLDRGRAGMAAGFLTRLRAEDRLVSADAVAAIHRPRVRTGLLVLLALVLLAALGAALWSTPWGHDLLTPVTTLFTDFVNWIRSSSGGNAG
ncbi:putative cytokinetic ring protein SteA [Actinomyces provencensis]|uniref:putative cytokinetic ring protein SteA n=1 Tax=Actinomyces provencensis TaxID=1720198 RepID=UPI001E36793C|nr:putative cytokinetic ring protein SteA [Actinomyces provencensis]